MKLSCSTVKLGLVMSTVILAVGTAACGPGGSGVSVSPESTAASPAPNHIAVPTTWTPRPPDVLGAGLTRIVDMAATPTGLIAVGSVTLGHKRVPAVWTSSDGWTWTRLATEPKSPYGFESELTTVAATPDGRVAAIGQAVGGAHGNPRVGSWYLDRSTLREVVAPVELYGGERQGSVDEMAAAPTGFVVVGMRTDLDGRTGAAVWTSPDAHDEFTIQQGDPQLESAPHELVRALGAAGNVHGFLAVGDITVDGRLDDDAIAWTSPDGRRWQRVVAAPGTFGGPGAELAELATSWRDGWAMVGSTTAGGATSLVAWIAPDGSHWRRVDLRALGTSPDVLSEATSLTERDGRLYLGARIGDRYVAARSDDGVRWTPIALPAGATSEPRARLLVLPLADRLVLAATTSAGTCLWTAPS